MRLLATLALGLASRFLGILQVVGAILGRLLFRFATEKAGLELADFAAEKLDFLVHFVQALDGSSMHALPIASLLPEFEILPLQACHLGTQLVIFRQQPCRRDRRFTDPLQRGCDKHAIHDMPVVPSTVPTGKEQSGQ